MKNRIFFVTASVTGGGAENMLLNIINSLSTEENELSLVNLCKGDRPTKLKKDVRYLCYNKVTTKGGFIRLMKDINKDKPNFLFTTSSTVGYLLILLKKILRARFKVYIRVAVPPSESVLKDIKSSILKEINKICYKKADLIIAQTEYMKLDLEKNFNLKKNKIKVIRNIVDNKSINERSSFFVPKELKSKNYNIISVGALYSVKGFDLLIHSLANICNSLPNIRLYILGEERYEIGYKKKLQKMINDYKLEGQIFLLGQKENPYPYFANADLSVMCSKHEGYPNVVLEALSLQTPVVVTDVVDFSEIINEDNGVIVERNNIESLTKGILKAFRTLNKPIKKVEIENFDYNQLFKK